MDEQHPDADGAVAEQLRSQRVSDGLKLAFQALGGPAVPDDDRPRWHQRLIAITNSAKHDLATAERRLDAWWAEWDAEVGDRPAG